MTSGSAADHLPGRVNRRLEREMAGNQLAARRVRLQGRLLLSADFSGSPTPGAEPAARWWLRSLRPEGLAGASARSW
jgi:hypothetical protein